MRKHVNEITSEFKPYWQEHFKKLGIDNPAFLAKLCYSSNDFGLEKVPGLRFYASELSKEQDLFIELFDWEDKPYEGKRILYKHSYNSNWKYEPDTYREITRKSDGTVLSSPTYAVKLSNLEFVSEGIVLAEPEPAASTGFKPIMNLWSTPEKEEKIEDEEEEDFMGKDKDDNHYAQMTIRDIYCIFHNVPHSNKKWLNSLIKQNK